MRSIKKTCSIALLSAILSGPAIAKNQDIDPYISFNQAMFSFNTGLYHYFVTPLTKVYKTIFPNIAQTGVHNFFSNLGTIPDIGNDILQTNFKYAGHDLLRLFLNTTLGLFGLVDVASDAGIYSHPQSFGLTLAKWGFKDSSYLVLPFFGPSTTRDTIGMVPDYFMSAGTYYTTKDWKYYAATGLKATDTASRMIPKQNTLTENALNPYIAVRSAYLQYQAYAIKQVDNEEIPKRVKKPQ